MAGAHQFFLTTMSPARANGGRWFAQYTAFQLHYAEIAAREGCKLFITGCEMTMTEHREAEWRQLLAAVRGVYPGTLTYNCDKYGEDHIAWWDAVDVIASERYYPLQTGRASWRASDRWQKNSVSTCFLPRQAAWRCMAPPPYRTTGS